MTELGYPQLEPYETGFLDVSDGQRIYWEISGNPEGKPAVVLHGGPGSGSSPRSRQFFDPDLYRLVLFDQRGCGRSTPHVSDPATDLDANTTWHLVADIEQLRAHLRVDRWLVFGGSWGSSLALAYAQKHPDRVTELVLTGVCALRRRESEWYWGGGAGLLFPEAWERFLAPLPAKWRDYPRCIVAYAKLLEDPEPSVYLRAAAAWNRWDEETASLQPPSEPRPFDARTGYAAARICNHFARYDGWVCDGELIAGATALQTIPGIIVQGRYDIQTPARTAWELARAWPAAELWIVQAGHSSSEPMIGRGLTRATDRFVAER